MHTQTSTEGTYTVTVTIHQKQIKGTYTQSHNAELLPTKAIHGNTYAGLLRDWRHPQTFTQNPKEKESRDFPERVVQPCSLDLDSELPPTWSAGSYLAPARVAAQRHERGLRRYLSADKGEGKLLMLGVGKGGWWTLRPAGVVSGPRADDLGTGRRLVPPEADGKGQ